MFLITPCIVRVKSISFSLYIVTQMKSSVSRSVAPIFCRSLYPRSTKSFGSQVTAVYRMWVNSTSSRLGRKEYKIVGILHSKISSPLMSFTSFFAICACRAPRLSCFPDGAGPYNSSSCSFIEYISSSAVRVESDTKLSRAVRSGR